MVRGRNVSRWWRVALVLLWMPVAAAAQDEAQPRGEDTAVLAGWPDSLAAAAQDFEEDAYQLLPRIDTLALDYRYAAASDGAQMSFVLAWRPGAEGLYEGRVQPYEALPPDVRMASVELLADVVVDGRDVAEMIVAVDSMALPPHPSVYAFEVDSLDYGAVFLDTPADTAQRYFEEGFALRNLRVHRIAFASYGAEPARTPEVTREEPPPSPRPRPPRSVYTPRTHIFIGWRVGPRPRYVRRPARNEQPRGDAVGRTAEETDRGDAPARGERAGEDEGEDEAARDGTSTRSGQRGRSEQGEEKDRDDEDEDSLLPASVAAVAAVGVVAVAGGTVGYHGTGRTPLGLTAGWARPAGGALLQASINTAVLGADGRQHLEGKVLGFVDAFEAPLQPAVGVGALATAEGDETTVEPSLTLGAVGNFGRVLVIGGYDVLRQAAEFGFAINFRFNPEVVNGE